MYFTRILFTLLARVTNARYQVWVESDLGRMGGLYVIDYDVNTAKFVLNSEPVVIG